MLLFLLPVMAVAGALALRAHSLREKNTKPSEEEKLAEWRAALSRGDLVQFRLLDGHIVDDAEVVLIEKGRQRALVSSESDQKAWVSMDSIYPPSYVFE